MYVSLCIFHSLWGRWWESFQCTLKCYMHILLKFWSTLDEKIFVVKGISSNADTIRGQLKLCEVQFQQCNVYWNPEIWHLVAQFHICQSAVTYFNCLLVMCWRSCGVLFFWEAQLFRSLVFTLVLHSALLIEAEPPVFLTRKFMGGINITLSYSGIGHWYVLSRRNLLSVEEIKIPKGSHIIRSLQTDGEASLKPCHYILPVSALMLVLARDYFVHQVSRCRCIRLL